MLDTQKDLKLAIPNVNETILHPYCYIYPTDTMRKIESSEALLQLKCLELLEENATLKKQLEECEDALGRETAKAMFPQFQ